MITQEYLKELLHYDPDTGLFKWKTYRGAITPGKSAGSVNKKGYLVIKINGKRYNAQRLSWLYMRGSMPFKQIDHINHNKLDNRIVNLREVTIKQNARNQSIAKNNTSGHTGVFWVKRDKRWQAQIEVDGKKKHLGLFVNKEDAIYAREKANAKYGFHANHGQRLQG